MLNRLSSIMTTKPVNTIKPVWFGIFGCGHFNENLAVEHIFIQE